MKNEKNYMGFLMIKIWQILQHFSRALSLARSLILRDVRLYSNFPKEKNVKTTNILNMIKSYPSVENVSLISSYLTTYDCQHLTFFVDEWSRRRQNPDTLTSWTQVTNRIASLLHRSLSLWSAWEFLNLVFNFFFDLITIRFLVSSFLINVKNDF